MYPIIDVAPWATAGDEVMGSKPKSWLKDKSGIRWLFKERHRLHTGDDWAEKIAAEIAAVLGIPHAVVELAELNGRRGIVTRDLVQELNACELVLGNSLLVEVDPAYPMAEQYHLAEHTIDRVHEVLTQSFIRLPPNTPQDASLQTPPDLFVSYLLLDALLGNTDRHHENWAVLQMSAEGADRDAILCPSYDHASSLGHNLQDAEREERLTTRDVNRQVLAFVHSPKVRSALYKAATDKKPLSPYAAFRTWAEKGAPAAEYWLQQLAKTPQEVLTDIVANIPTAIMSDVSQRFACAMLNANRDNLLNGPT